MIARIFKGLYLMVQALALRTGAMVAAFNLRILSDVSRHFFYT